MKRIVAAGVVILAVLAGFSPAALSAQTVADTANVFTPEQQAGINAYHAKLAGEFGIDYRVVTTNDTGDINLFANKYFNDEKVGAADGRGRGLLLVVNPAQNLVRLEVATVLEPVFTDAFVSYIEHRQMIPFFKAGQVSNGILAATELVFARVIDAIEGKAFDETALTGSTGGGAVNKAAIGEGMEAKSSKSIASNANSPEAVVAAYLAAMEARNSNPDLPIYSAATKEMQRKWVVTPAQMDMVARTFKKCTPQAAKIQGSRAVVRYAVHERECSPYFLVREDGEWKLDLTMMMKGIRFNHKNEWHFDMNAVHDYGFAFGDWKLDKNGYPH